MFDISLKSNFREIERSLSNFAFKQMPYAQARAMTELGKLVVKAEVANMQKVLDRPTPFTLKSVGIKGATKDSQQTTIFIKDIAAVYLEPYEFGGINKLSGRALLRPANIGLNQYGNLPKSKLAQLKGKKNIFIGAIKTERAGTINGVWQRIPAQAGKPAGLKLLIKFEDAHPVHQHLGWRELAKRVIDANYKRVLGAALAKAIATAK